MSGSVEAVLNERLQKGESLVLGRLGGHNDLSMLPVDRWQERTVSAEAVRDLCARDSGSEQRKIDGVRIEGILDLSAVVSQRALVLSNCLFTDRIILADAHLAALDLSGSTFVKDVCAKNLRCGALVMRNVVAKDCVDLRYAEIDGPLECQDAAFEASSLECLVIRGATINRSMLLMRARVSGAVAATAVTVHGALMCTEMTVKGAPWVEGEPDRFDEPRGRSPGAARVAFMLDSARIDGIVRMCGSPQGKSFTACGLVHLYGAHMGRLVCEEATFDSADGICLSLEHAVVTNSVLLRRGFKAIGTVRLFAAEIGDSLEMDGAVLSASSGLALSAERLSVAGPVMLREKFSADGCVRFSNATIGAFVNCSEASFHKASSPPTPPKWPYDVPVDDIALSFAGADIGGDLFMSRGFHATGRVALNRTRVKGSLILGGRSSAQIKNDGFAVDAFAFTAGQAIVVRKVTLRGVVDMRQASCAVLEDEIVSWPPVVVDSMQVLRGEDPADHVPAGYPWVRPNINSDQVLVYKSGLFLDGFTYDVLQSEGFAWKQRRLIFKKTIDRNRPQPYLQLAKVYNQAGSAETAKVQVARLNAANSPLKPSWWILRPLIGYGYRPLRAAFFLVAFALIGGYFFGFAAHDDLFVPTHAASDQTVLSSKCRPESYPCFHPYAYSFDSLLPVLNLKERDFWTPNVQRAPWVGALAWSLNGFGWLVGLLVIAGFTNIIRKE